MTHLYMGGVQCYVLKCILVIPVLDRRKSGGQSGSIKQEQTSFQSLCIMMMPAGQIIHLKAILCSGT